MTTLHLTKAEIAMFEKLPAALREGWTVEEEKLTFEDTDARRAVRLEMVRVENAGLKSFLEKSKTVGSPEEYQKLMQKTDMTHVETNDILELFFAAGPDTATLMIGMLLESMTRDEVLSDIADLTRLRHELLESLQNLSI